MGYRPLVLIALPLLLTGPALAQQQEEAAPVFNLPRQAPPADPDRQGPELNVYRGAPVQVTRPPAVAPTVTPPPPVVAPQPTPQNTAPQPSAPAQPPRPARQATPAPAAESPAPAPAPKPTAPAPQAAPEPAAPAPEPPLEPAAQPESGNWQWIAAGAAALALLIAAAWLLLRRRSGLREDAEEPFFMEEEAEPPAPAPIPPPKPAAPKRQPASSPANDSDRPWIDLMMEVRGARLSLMGATIDYRLTLHNRGTRPADDLLVRSLIANADAHQQQALQQFFAGTLGLPSHSVVSVAPGETHRLTGQLRLMHDQIAPVRMGERSLLIPLVAFDAQYRWKGADRDGHGRSARAFIVGQEASPPTERLAPFRLDMGPRQFRTPGSRATALELAS